MDTIVRTILMYVIKRFVKQYSNGKITPVQIKIFLDGLLAKYITEENIKKVIDSLLDKLEKLADKTDTKFDDLLLAEIRKLFNIADNDEPKKDDK